MRQVINPQKPLGAQSISAIQFDPKSRMTFHRSCGVCNSCVSAYLPSSGVIPASTREGREGPADVSTGRPGMDQWKILVLGTLRLDLNADFDRVVLPKKVSAPRPIRPTKAIPSASVCAAVIRRWNRPSTHWTRLALTVTWIMTSTDSSVTSP